MSALFVLVVGSTVLACGGSRTSETPSASSFSPRSAGRPLVAEPFAIPLVSKERSDAPLDPEIAQLGGASAFWLGAPGGRTYVVRVEGRAAQSMHPPLILVHGLGTAGVRDYYPVIEALSAARTVYAIDLPGLARSELGQFEPSPEVLAGRVVAVVNTLVDGPFDLVGHSLGGNVCLTAAGHPAFEPRRLVLVDVAGVLHREAFARSQADASIAPIQDVHEGAAGVLTGVSRRFIEASSMFDPGDQVVAGSGGKDDVMTRAALRLIVHDVAPYWAGISAPTLLLWGERDRVAPLRTAQLLDDRIVDSRLLVFGGVGHTPMREVPEQWSEAVLSFVDPETLVPAMRKGPSGAAHRERTIDCSREDVPPIDGRYRSLHLIHCEDVRVVGAEIDRLIVEESTVELVAVEVHHGIVAHDSVLMATGGTFRGEVAVYLEDSDADFAGTVIVGSGAGIATEDGARLLLSAVRLRSPHQNVTIHDQIDLRARQAL